MAEGYNKGTKEGEGDKRKIILWNQLIHFPFSQLAPQLKNFFDMGNSASSAKKLALSQ